MIGNVLQDNTSSTDHGVMADRDSRTDGDGGAEPRVIADDDRSCSLPPLATPSMIIDRVQRCHQLGSRPDPHVRADRDQRIIHEEPVRVDERVGSKPNVVSVAALEPRHHQSSLTNLTQKAAESLRADSIVVRRSPIERVESTPTLEPTLTQLVIIDIPLTTSKTIRLFSHTRIVAHRAATLRLGTVHPKERCNRAASMPPHSSFQLSRSMTVTFAVPPPSHMVWSPYRPSMRSSSCSIVANSLVPVAPRG